MANPPIKAVLIVNPEAGRNRANRPKQIQNAQLQLECTGISVSIVETKKRGDGKELACNAVRDGAELIVVCGGDGTINEVVCGMVHSNVPLAVLPGGTANILVRELGLPLDIQAAAGMISHCAPRRISLGRVGARHFILMTGSGFDAHVVSHVDEVWKKRFGMATYIFEAIRQALTRPLVPFTLSAEAGNFEVTFACISKARYYGPLQLVREASLFSDRLHVYCFQTRNRLRYFRYALAVLAGNTSSLGDVKQFAASTIRCDLIGSGLQEVLLHTDGELVGHLPNTISIVPDALTLLIPPQGKSRI